MTRFKTELTNTTIMSPCPPLFKSETSTVTRAEAAFFEPLMQNFVEWYWSVAQKNIGSVVRLFEELKEVLPGFESLSMVESGESSRVLKAAFHSRSGDHRLNRYNFDQLSDGQRSLVALYSLLHLVDDGRFPMVRQSGEQWVRTRFPEELKRIRRRQRALLVVVIDADVGSTGDRHTQLEQQCREAGVERRKPEDPVIVAVPRRNIETWFAYLRGQSVDETIEYPRLRREGDCKLFADRLHGMCHEQQRLDEPAPPSLREVCDEYGKLRKLR